ncbi:MAG: winged helix-turn-helix transcriptional regulator [Methanosarcinales archaeon]|nr:winged helix-turn-helix transcriptional regulator [Methanosarcinales archaeon]
MNEIDVVKIHTMAKMLSEVTHLNETDIFILLSLMADSKITNNELAKVMDYKDGNSVAYHIRTMQKDGIIDKFTVTPNWKRVGLPTEFSILAEAENEEHLLEIEKLHIKIVDEYLSNQGDMVVIPMITGCVLLENVYHCFGDRTMAVIEGRATSDQDAAVYSKNYLVNRYPNVKVSLLINKYKTISDFFINKHTIEKLKEFFQFNETGEPGSTIEDLHDLPLEG